MSTQLELIKQASTLEQQAYHSYVQNYVMSGITTLVKGGVEFEKASSLVKVACENDATTSKLKVNIDLFEKIAEYVETLESQVGTFEKKAETTKAIEESDPLQKLASIGYSEEEIELMRTLPENLITKVASSVSEQPWEMGAGTGFSRERTDPLLEFILG